MTALLDSEQASSSSTQPARGRLAGGRVAVGLLLLGFLLILGAALEVPYLATQPGRVVEVHRIIDVDGAQSFETSGELFFLTISRPSDPLTLLEWFEAWRDPDVDLIRRDLVIPEGQTGDQRRLQNLQQMMDSQRIAVAVALDRLGYEVPVVGTGALISGVLEGSAGFGTLQPDDIVVAVDGAEIQFAQDLIGEVRAREVGEAITLTISRDNELQDVQLVLGESGADPGLPAIGISVAEAGTAFEFPFDISIEAGTSGGSSAGMMLTLGVYNRLSESDITRGHRIAGTGTMAADGTVGPIGGIKQKTIAAVGIGAEYILVPEADFEAAVETADGEIEVIAVATIDEALEFLESLEPI